MPEETKAASTSTDRTSAVLNAVFPYFRTIPMELFTMSASTRLTLERLVGDRVSPPTAAANNIISLSLPPPDNNSTSTSLCPLYLKNDKDGEEYRVVHTTDATLLSFQAWWLKGRHRRPLHCIFQCEDERDIAPFRASLNALRPSPASPSSQEHDIPLLKITIRAEGVVSLSSLVRFPFLCHVELANAPELTSIAPLSSCESLETICLDRCPGVTTLQGLEGLPALRGLIASGSPLSSLEALSTSEALRVLEVNDCPQLLTLDPLNGHRDLREVRVRGSAIGSLSPLSLCEALQILDISGTRVDSLEVLKGKSELRYLNAAETAITSLAPLSSCTDLESLTVSGCKGVTSLEGLESLQKLKRLRAGETSLTSIEPLASCMGLVEVYLSGCRGVTSLTPLAGLPQLTIVAAPNTAVCSKEWPSDCPSLEFVDFGPE